MDMSDLSDPSFSMYASQTNIWFISNDAASQANVRECGAFEVFPIIGPHRAESRSATLASGMRQGHRLR